MLTVLSMFLPCTQWVFGPLSPVSETGIQCNLLQETTRARMDKRLTEIVRQHSLSMVIVELRRMQSSLEDSARYQETLAGNQELILGLAQAWILEMQGAFLPITLEGDQSPAVAKEAHILGEANADGEPYFQDDYEL